MVLSPMAWPRLLPKISNQMGSKIKIKGLVPSPRETKASNEIEKPENGGDVTLSVSKIFCDLFKTKTSFAYLGSKIPGAVNYLSARWNSSYCCYSTMKKKKCLK